MRLWHKDLISVLPRQQLLGQWRECCLIAKNIKEKGTPNHILVNKIMDYPIDHFLSYTIAVYLEMYKRGYKCNTDKFVKYFKDTSFKPIVNEHLFKDWHNGRYLLQCLYNLQEKYDCGDISKAEYDKLYDIGGVMKNERDIV